MLESTQRPATVAGENICVIRRRIRPAKLFNEQILEIEPMEQVAGLGEVQRHDGILLGRSAFLATGFVVDNLNMAMIMMEGGAFG